MRKMSTESVLCGHKGKPTYNIWGQSSRRTWAHFQNPHKTFGFTFKIHVQILGLPPNSMWKFWICLQNKNYLFLLVYTFVSARCTHSCLIFWYWSTQKSNMNVEHICWFLYASLHALRLKLFGNLVIQA